MKKSNIDCVSNLSGQAEPLICLLEPWVTKSVPRPVALSRLVCLWWRLVQINRASKTPGNGSSMLQSLGLWSMLAEVRLCGAKPVLQAAAPRYPSKSACHVLRTLFRNC